MEMMSSLLGWVMIIFISRIILNILFRFVQSRSLESQQAIMEKNNEPASNSPHKVVVDMVQDTVCGNFIAKDQAYIVARDHEKHYFCSWECREKFIEKNKENEKE